MNPKGTPQNLRPFQKGQAGNPGGMRKGLSLTRLVRDELQKPEKPGSKVTNAERVAQKIVELAKQGNPIFTPLVWRYTDGDPKQAADLTLRELIAQVAEKMGLDPDELLAAVERDLGAA